MTDTWKLHEDALARGETHYVDPVTGFRVFTSLGLENRGRCCGAGCRHCPYGHENVPSGQKAARIQRPSWMTDLQPGDDAVDVLFWSSGKDSFLTLRALQREALRPVVLLTTFDARERFVAHQEVGIDNVVRQAQHLGLPLLGVPLQPGRDYVEQVGEGISVVPSVGRLVFGDLHLEHIRDWREAALGPIAEQAGATTHYPLWHVEYDDLMDDLEASGVACEVSAVTDGAQGSVEIGERYTRALMEGLPDGVDRFGENGEFHTLAKVWEWEYGN